MARPRRPRAGLCAFALAIAGQATAQTPWHDRGPGELLPPRLREGPPGGDVNADLTVVAFLWAFHGDALLPATEVRLPAAPTLRNVAAVLLAASHEAGEELRWQSLWAHARIARSDAAIAKDLHARILDGRLLAAGDRTAEVACVAAGLAARDDVTVLGALAKVAIDAARPERLRAFAFYGLGLAAQESAVATVQFRVLAAVEKCLLATDTPPAVVAAALHALALTNREAAPDLAAPALARLEVLWQTSATGGLIDVRAGVPIAVAALLPPDAKDAEVWRERFAAVAEAGTTSLALSRSSVIALGRLCRPWQDAASPDARYGEKLRRLTKDARDLQARYYAWIAMGVAGGDEHRAFLFAGLQASWMERPWAAMGLATLAAGHVGDAAGLAATLDTALTATRNPQVREAYGQALRVLRPGARDAEATFRDRYRVLLPGAGEPDARATQLAAVVGDGTADPATRILAAIALGHLGDAGPRHWSTRLARTIDYRSATPVLVGLPNGVLRLP